MADSQEEVRYQYTGSVSSLRQATEAAIGLLNKYQTQIDRISADGGFGKSAKAAKSFQSQITATTKQITGMQKQMKTVSDVRLFPSSQVTQQLQVSLGSIAQVFGKLSTSSKLSTKEVQSLTSQLRAANSGLKSNAAEVTALIQKEQKWQQTLDNVDAKTRKFRGSLDNLFGKVSNIFDPITNKLNNLGTPLPKLTSRLQAFRDKASEAFGRVSQLASTVASAFRRVSTAEGDAADATNKSTTAHTRLSNILTSLRNAFKKETSSIDDEDNTLKRKNSTLRSSNRQHTSLRSVLISLGRAFSSESNKLNNFNINLKSMTTAAKLGRNALSGLVSVPISQWLAEAAKQSISYTENINLFTVAMGESLDVGTEFVNQMSEIYGMDPSNLMRYAGNFYQLMDAIDVSSDAASKMSLSLLKLTNDVSSLFNIPINTVFENLSSGMQGMSRAVRKYGMDIRTTTLQQTALSLGITENVENMSEANRQGLRYITMVRQASNASGDFARTIESPANQLKIFKEQITQLGRSIGDLFIGPLANAIRYINGFVMALRLAISFIGSILGLVNSVSGDTNSATDEAADSIDSIGTSADKATKKLKAMLAPFDELNVLSQPSDSSQSSGLGEMDDLDPAIAAEIENMELQLENLRMKALDVRDSLLQFFGFKVEDGAILSWDSSEFETNLINKFPQWTQTIQATFDNWTSIVNSFKNVFNALAGVVQAVWDRVAGFLGKFVNDDTVAAFITDLSTNLNDFAGFLNNNQSTIADFVLILGALLAAFKAFGTISTLIGPVSTFISTCAAALAPFASVIGWVAAIVAVIAVLYTTSDAFAVSFNNLILAIGEGLGTVFAALWETLQVVWTDIQTLWNDNILPMLTSIGDALAPVIDTIVGLWTVLVEIVVDVFDTIERVWTTTLKPVLAAFFDAISNLAAVFEVLWTEVIGPVVSHIAEGFKQLWTTTLRPIFENIIGYIGGVIEVGLWLWNNVWSPLVKWMLEVLAPVFVNVFNQIWDRIQNVIANIGQMINGLIKIFRGITDFIAGVFMGDWSRAWQGIVEVFSGLWDTVSGVFKLVMNVVIGLINGVLSGISSAINSVIRAVNKISFTVPDWVPAIGGKTMGFNFKEINTWSIPYLESGAVVTSPTLAMIGEGKHDEAVIPLGNSPQMKDLVNQIADATKNRGGSEPIHVSVYIGNEQVAEYIHRAERRSLLQTNGGI